LRGQAWAGVGSCCKRNEVCLHEEWSLADIFGHREASQEYYSKGLAEMFDLELDSKDIELTEGGEDNKLFGIS